MKCWCGSVRDNLGRAVNRRVIALLAAFALVLACASSAQGATQRLDGNWYYDEYDRIARVVSGVPDLRLLMVDSEYDWVVYLAGDPNTAAFVCLLATPGHWCYRKIWVSPHTSRALGLQGATVRPWWEMLTTGTVSLYDATEALITFLHETYHWRLFSADEGRVQACTIRDLPYWLSAVFRIPATTTTTQTVPEQRTTMVEESYDVRVKYKKRIWVKRNGNRVRVWVTRYRWETRYRMVPRTETVYVQRTTTVPNPNFQTLVSTANAIHAAERPPYGGGTCY